MKIRYLCLTGLMLATMAAQAEAAFVNGGFESGDLTGWTNTSNVSVVTSFSTFTPYEGNYFAVLDAGLGQDVYTTLEQTFAASSGSTVSGAAFFFGNDTVDYNDDGYVKILQNNVTLFSANISDVGPYGTKPWTAFSYTFVSTDNFTIQAGVRNRRDNSNPSSLGIDAVLTSSAAVPEPASLAMWGLGAIGMVFARRRRQQKKLMA